MAVKKRGKTHTHKTWHEMSYFKRSGVKWLSVLPRVRSRRAPSRRKSCDTPHPWSSLTQSWRKALQKVPPAQVKETVPNSRKKKSPLIFAPNLVGWITINSRILCDQFLTRESSSSLRQTNRRPLMLSVEKTDTSLGLKTTFSTKGEHALAQFKSKVLHTSI